MGNITLVLGGIKSGKTGFAEKKAMDKELLGGKILYIATAQALDNEMKSRIKNHQSSRPKTWETIEEPINIVKVIADSGNKYDLILFDCLTLWITNKIMKAGEGYIREDLMKSIIDDTQNLLNEIKKSKSDVIIVSNQVESGLISEYKMGRLFQDLAGLLHQKIGRDANNVILMQAGFPTILKGDI